jgi:hypothetical protein
MLETMCVRLYYKNVQDYVLCTVFVWMYQFYGMVDAKVDARVVERHRRFSTTLLFNSIIDARVVENPRRFSTTLLF